MRRIHHVRKLAALGASVALLIGIGGCGQDAPTPTPTVTVDPDTDVDKSAVPDPELPATWPLTGVAADDIEERPAIAVKIENTAAARPQSGLEDADVVWETIVEFDVSRFVAVFHSRMPAEVGPVRSTRPMDVPIASPLHPLFVFSGGQRGILDLVDASDMQVISHDAGAAGLHRISSRRAPHNVYADLPTILGSADDAHRASPPAQFAFALEAAQASAVLTGSDAASVSLDMSSAARPSWAWDAGSGTWLRSESASPALAASGAQLAATNVVVLDVESYDSGYDAQGGAPVPALSLSDSSGEGIVASGGRAVAVTWSKGADADPIVLTL
ncbi:MAG: DUF3048 domain-containing protein, partial [Cellulomonadaceae bacterium]